MKKVNEFVGKYKQNLASIGVIILIALILVSYPHVFTVLYESGKDFGANIVRALMS